MAKEAEFCNIQGVNIKVFSYKTVIIGGGCAGLNCADSLYDLGAKDIAIITNGINLSTSINTGSDKQTYYKLSTSGAEQDSVYDMAKTLYSGGCMEGYHALTEAAMSLKCFYKLISLGVDFPQNDYGEYVGYRTDHDYRKRATSCGPLTSKYMAEALFSSVSKKSIDVIENKFAVKILKDENKVRGVVCIDTIDGSLYVYMSPNVVLATGGPSGIYDSSVYPKCHRGSLGLAMEAGCIAVNLTEWQYGIASTDFRWNLSGSYMQVIPRFVSIDKEGNEKEFLHEYIGEERYDLIFQKGYNWPFCPSKLTGENKSSLIDIAVHRERLKGNMVYLDFTKNDSAYDPSKLCDEAKEYLLSCDVLNLETPIKRLRKMNERAYRLYYQNADIDLEKKALKIDVCAQHNNGGIDCDVNYMTSVEGLYCAGECAGVFGVARPGGTALNSTQVSSLKAAEHIVKANRSAVDLGRVDKAIISDIVDECIRFSSGDKGALSILENKRRIGRVMSEKAAFIRSKEGVEDAIHYINERLSSFETENAIFDITMLFEVFSLKDILISSKCVLESQKRYIEEGFLSRGSYLVIDDISSLDSIDGVETEKDLKTVIKVSYDGSNAFSYLDKVSEIPDSEQWFEKVYNSYY